MTDLDALRAQLERGRALNARIIAAEQRCALLRALVAVRLRELQELEALLAVLKST